MKGRSQLPQLSFFLFGLVVASILVIIHTAVKSGLVVHGDFGGPKLRFHWATIKWSKYYSYQEVANRFKFSECPQCEWTPRPEDADVMVFKTQHLSAEVF